MGGSQTKEEHDDAVDYGNGSDQSPRHPPAHRQSVIVKASPPKQQQQQQRQQPQGSLDSDNVHKPNDDQLLSAAPPSAGGAGAGRNLPQLDVNARSASSSSSSSPSSSFSSSSSSTAAVKSLNGTLLPPLETPCHGTTPRVEDVGSSRGTGTGSGWDVDVHSLAQMPDGETALDTYAHWGGVVDEGHEDEDEENGQSVRSASSSTSGSAATAGKVENTASAAAVESKASESAASSSSSSSSMPFKATPVILKGNHSNNNKKQGGGVNSMGTGNRSRNPKLQATLQKTMRQTLCKSDLRQLVRLPPNADTYEWIALNTIHFTRMCISIFDSYSMLCSPSRNSACTTMSASDTEYLWKDHDQYPKPTSVPASTYIKLALREAEVTTDNPAIFPIDENDPFPVVFMPKVREIFKRLFRMFAHLYYGHYAEIKTLAAGGTVTGVDPSVTASRRISSDKHLNSCFKHFILFALEFQLLDDATLNPLQSFIHAIKQHK